MGQRVQIADGVLAGELGRIQRPPAKAPTPLRSDYPQPTWVEFDRLPHQWFPATRLRAASFILHFPGSKIRDEGQETSQCDVEGCDNPVQKYTWAKAIPTQRIHFMGLCATHLRANKHVLIAGANTSLNNQEKRNKK